MSKSRDSEKTSNELETESKEEKQITAEFKENFPYPGFDLIKKKAEAGNADAQATLGEIYTNPKNHKNLSFKESEKVRSFSDKHLSYFMQNEGFKWYLKAAKQGNPKGEYQLYLYLEEYRAHFPLNESYDKHSYHTFGGHPIAYEISGKIYPAAFRFYYLENTSRSPGICTFIGAAKLSEKWLKKALDHGHKEAYIPYARTFVYWGYVNYRLFREIETNPPETILQVARSVRHYIFEKDIKNIIKCYDDKYLPEFLGRLYRSYFPRFMAKNTSRFLANYLDESFLKIPPEMIFEMGAAALTIDFPEDMPVSDSTDSNPHKVLYRSIMLFKKLAMEKPALFARLLSLESDQVREIILNRLDYPAARKINAQFNQQQSVAIHETMSEVSQQSIPVEMSLLITSYVPLVDSKKEFERYCQELLSENKITPESKTSISEHDSHAIIHKITQLQAGIVEQSDEKRSSSSSISDLYSKNITELNHLVEVLEPKKCFKDCSSALVNQLSARSEEFSPPEKKCSRELIDKIRELQNQHPEAGSNEKHFYINLLGNLKQFVDSAVKKIPPSKSFGIFPKSSVFVKICKDVEKNYLPYVNKMPAPEPKNKLSTSA